MEERQRDDDDVDDDVEDDVDDDDDDGDIKDTVVDSGHRGTLWVILVTLATIFGRRALTGAFPYPVCFVLLIQITTYLAVALVVLFLKSKEILLWQPERPCTSQRPYTWFEVLVIGLRLLFHTIVSSAAAICGAVAIQHYTSLPVLAVLPMFTYVMDSLLFRLAVVLRLIRSEQLSSGGFWRVILALSCILLAVYDDYRLNVSGLLFAVISHTLVSLAKLIPRIGSRIDNGSVHTWDCPLYAYLGLGIPPMIITTFIAFKFEDIGSAYAAARSWGLWGLLSSLVPAALLFMIFKSSMNTAYHFTTYSAPGVLEDSTPQARTAIAITSQSSFWITCVGVFLGEKNLVSWVQVLAFVLLYVVTVGTRTIGFYPPRLMNLLARILRKPQQKVMATPWQLPFFLWITISIFVVLFSSTILYWNTEVAYSRDAKNWGSGNVKLDRAYGQPQPHLFDIVIAHSEGDPLNTINELIAAFATREEIQPNSPRVKIYSKDQSLNTTDLSNFTSSFTGPVTAVALHNSGGIQATYLHHILLSWGHLSRQTLFLSTSHPTISNLRQVKKRFDNYFVPALPVNSERAAEPRTSFLNLGEYATCACTSCSDSLGWADTFHLVPSMFGAAYRRGGQGSEVVCKDTLLTRGNNFVAGAERIRGLERDVYQMLYDALTNPSLRDAWAHDPEKLPAGVANPASTNGEENKGNGVSVDSFKGVWDGKKKGKNGKDQKAVFGVQDTLETPYLGYTIERLWGILLQCSTKEIAWRCPAGLWRRRGGETADCGCLVW